MRQVFCAVVILCMMCAAMVPLAQAEEILIAPLLGQEEVSGEIQDVDYEARLITIKSYKDAEEEIYQIISAFVLEEAVIERKDNGVSITLKDLEAGDRIVLRCTVNDFGQYQADHIWLVD